MYYDLAALRKEHAIEKTLPSFAWRNSIRSRSRSTLQPSPGTLTYRKSSWCQEEPQNQGAWYQIRHRLQAPLADSQRLSYAGRPGAAAPASGIFGLHALKQNMLLLDALSIDPDEASGKARA